MTVLLEARAVTKRFGGGVLDRGSIVALDGFSLAIDTDKPSIIAVVGESGSGKTTLARLLLGLTDPTEGQILYKGQDVASLAGTAMRGYRTDVQAIFQDPYGVYNPFYRVDHVLTTPVARFKLASSKAEARAMIEDALRAVGLRPEEILGRFPHQISGGQRQRIMVARALLLKPRIIIADEPVSMVDASLRATILGSIRTLRDERGISILYITHDLATAYQVSDSIIVLYRASVAEAGDAGSIIQSPQHPYTNLLIGSIPQVSTTRDWLGAETGPLVEAGATSSGCRFAPRCPVAMPRCTDAVPPLYRTEAHRAVGCYQFDSAPIVPAADLTDVLSTAAPHPVAA